MKLIKSDISWSENLTNYPLVAVNQCREVCQYKSRICKVSAYSVESGKSCGPIRRKLLQSPIPLSMSIKAASIWRLPPGVTPSLRTRWAIRWWFTLYPNSGCWKIQWIKLGASGAHFFRYVCQPNSTERQLKTIEYLNCVVEVVHCALSSWPGCRMQDAGGVRLLQTWLWLQSGICLHYRIKIILPAMEYAFDDYIQIAE